MQVLNYTGKRIGLANPAGNPIEVLPSDGLARVEITLEPVVSDSRFSIFRKAFGTVKNLPEPDPNNKKSYIVTKEVAEAVRNFRFDLLVPEEPFTYEGATFYKKLINV